MEAKEDEITFFVYSEEFFFAAEELEKSNNPRKVATASYYLYGHSLELIYKSYLFKKGMSISKLKKIGHDLENTLNKCVEFDIENHLDLNENYWSIIRGINKYYSKKEFEYMTRTEKTFPHLGDVKEIVKLTSSSLFNEITRGLW